MQRCDVKNQIRYFRRRAQLTQGLLARATGVGVPQVSKWESGKVDIPTTRLQDIAAALEVTVEMLLADIPGEHPNDAAAPRHPDMPWLRAVAPPLDGNGRPFEMEGASEERMRDDLPIYGSALGSARRIDGEAIEQTTLNRAEVIQYARRPVILNGNASAYGLYVSGSSMEPRHMDGDLLLVDPNGRVRGGEEVVVYLRPTDEHQDDGETARAVLVKRLVRRSSDFVELEQYQPPARFQISMSEIVRMDRVIPWQELLV